MQYFQPHLHYFAKFRSSLFYLEENATKMWHALVFKHTHTHRVVIHLAYLLTYLLFQFPVPVKYTL